MINGLIREVRRWDKPAAVLTTAEVLLELRVLTLIPCPGTPDKIMGLPVFEVDDLPEPGWQVVGKGRREDPVKGTYTLTRFHDCWQACITMENQNYLGTADTKSRALEEAANACFDD